jgi:cation diffusion facilitator family transporter
MAFDSLQAFLPKDDNLKQIFTVTIKGTVVNFFLTLIKISAGLIFGLNAVFADGIQSFTDLFSDTLLLFAVKFSYQPRSRAKPFGNRKLETAMALFICLVLVATAIGLFLKALSPSEIEELELLPGLFVSIVAVIAKEILFRFTLREGKRLKSPAVIANGWSHRADALSSGAVAVCIMMGMLFGNFAMWDKLGVTVVCILILKAAWGIGRDAIAELLDYAPSEAIMNQVEAIVDQDPDVVFAHLVRVRSVAGKLDISCTVEVTGSLTIQQGAEIVKRVEQSLYDNLEGIASIMIRIMPAGSFAQNIIREGIDNIAEDDLV